MDAFQPKSVPSELSGASASPRAQPLKPKHRWLWVALFGGVVGGLAAAGGWVIHGYWKQTESRSWKRASLVKHGGSVFQTYCARCHGPEGRGDGPMADNLESPPPILDGTVWQTKGSTAEFRKLIAEGIHATALPDVGRSLSPLDLDALAAFIGTMELPDREPLPAKMVMLLRRAGFTPAEGLQPAPPIDFYDGEGIRRSLAQFRGRFVLLHFWGTTCLPCLKELPGLHRLEQQYGNTELKVLCVCTDEPNPEKARRVAAANAPGLPVCVDALGTATDRYRIQVMPMTVLIDREGKIWGRADGVLGWSNPAVEELLRTCLKHSGGSAIRSYRTQISASEHDAGGNPKSPGQRQ